MSTSPNSVRPAEIQENQLPVASALTVLATQAAANVARSDQTADSAGGLKNLLFELGIEPTLTVHQAAAMLRWSYWKARRYFNKGTRNMLFVLPEEIQATVAAEREGST